MTTQLGRELRRAKDLVDGGHCAAALELLHGLVAAAPRNVDALNLLGLALHRLGHLTEAIAIFRVALRESDAHPFILINIGVALEDAGDAEQAERCYRLAVARDPRATPAIFNLGRLYLRRQDMAAAEHHFRRVTTLDPANCDAWLALGDTLLQMCRCDESERAFRRLLEVAPDSVDARVGIATALHSMRSGAAAAEIRQLCEQAIARAPADPRAWNLLGVVSQSSEPSAVAEHCYREALRGNPTHAPTLTNLGLLLTQSGRFDEATTLLEAARRQEPESPDCANNFGVLLLEQWRLVEAIEHYQDFVARHPAERCIAVHRNLGTALSRAARIPAAIRTLARVVALTPTDPLAHDNLLMALLYADTVTPEQIVERHGEYACFFELAPALARPAPAVSGPAPRLRVGFVSGDFRRHAVMQFLAGMLPGLRAGGIELHAFSNTATEDEFSLELQSRFNHWHDIRSLDDRAAAHCIAAAGIEVLVDLAGHTGDNRLGVFALRPAPTQVSWLGYPATTGLTAIDWRLVDHLTDPPEADRWHSERLHRFERCFIAFTPPPAIDNSALAPATRRFTFGCFNTLTKISELCRDTWARLLRELPEARLLLKSKALSDPRTWAEVRDWFVARGVAAEQIVIAAWNPSNSGHLESYREVDIALDPFPYNGTTTTCEALWMGVPVLTLAGRMHHGRVGLSLLSRLGLDDWIATSTDDYIARAHAWARRRPRLQALRTSLRERLRASEICDVDGFAADFAETLLALHRDQGGADAGRRELPSCCLDLPGAVSIWVPDSLNHISRYVLAEQGDWFEDEIRYLRQVCAADARVIDVGANYGVYTLSLARCNAASGQVVAFEPVPATMHLLRRSVADNGFVHVRCIEAAASNSSGEAAMQISGNAELNRLSDAPDGLRVATLALDSLLDDGPWDIVKIDAEGHEAAVVAGGLQLFRQDSPLVMLEVRAGAGSPDLVALQQLLALGYQAYRLVPGLMALAPVDPADDLDPFCLNLFACKPERAAALSAAGALIRGPAALTSCGSTDPQARHAHACALFVRSGEPGLPLEQRYACLHDSWQCITELVNHEPTVRRLSSFARIAAAWGRRAAAVHGLNHLLAESSDLQADEVALLADRRYDDRDGATGDLARIRLAAAEQLALSQRWSSFYGGPEEAEKLHELLATSAFPASLENRISLIRKRFFLAQSCP